MGILKKIKRGADRVRDFTGKVTDVLGFFGADVDGLIEGRKFPYRNHFHEMMDTWDFSVPNRNLWIVHIDHFPQALLHEQNNRSLVNILDQQGTYTSSDPRKWKTRKNVKTLSRYEYQDTPGGCLFAQGAVLPGEAFTTRQVTPKNHRGLIPGVVADTRQAFNPLTLQFRETNTSFIDNILRPWIILGSHYGLVARDRNDVKNVKSTVHVYQLGKTMADTPNVHRKVFSFYNCLPTDIRQTELTYDMDTQNEINSSQWVYTHYAVEQLPDLPMELVIDQIMGGGLMNVIDKAFDGKVGRAIGKVTRPIDSVKNAGKVLKNLF